MTRAGVIMGQRTAFWSTYDIMLKSPTGLLVLTSAFLFLLPTTTCEPQSACGEAVAPPRALARRRSASSSNSTSSVHLVGMFDVHEGAHCHLLRPGGMEQVLMTMAVLENGLAQFDLNGSHIGFDIYDTCSTPSATLHHLVHAVSGAGALTPECNQGLYVGVIGPKSPMIQAAMKSFLNIVGIPYVPLTLTSLNEEIKAITQVLADLRWKMVSVFYSSRSLKEEFKEEADRLNICITAYVSTEYSDQSETLLRMKLSEISTTEDQVAVVLGSGIDLRALFDTVLATNSTLRYWLLSGVDVEDDFLTILPPDYPVILFRKSPGRVPTFDSGVEDTYEFDEKIHQLNLVRSYIEYMDSCRKDLSGNALNDSRCGEQLRHSNLQKMMIEESVNQLLEDLVNSEMLKKFSFNSTEEYVLVDEFDLSPPEIEIWTYQHVIVKFSTHKELLIGHYYADGRLDWNKKALNVFRAMGSGWFKIPEFLCRQRCRERCSNYGNITVEADLDGLLDRVYHWRQETWVSVLLTVSCVGTVVAVLTAAFLVASSCREEFDGGSQLSNVVALAAVVAAYCCTMLFAFHRGSIDCHRRLAVVGLAYVAMQAPLLSRCFVLVAAESDAIHAHVSGLLQAVLGFFIAAVQVAMAAYFWSSHEAATTRDPSVSHGLVLRCAFEPRATLTHLSYAVFLSLAWLVASRLCARVRRNGREGLFLHLGGVAAAAVWLAWFLLFFLLPPRWREFTVCLGPVATATAVLVAVFLPRAHGLAAARRQGQAAGLHQPVVFASASSRSPNLSIYESVNHGFNPDKDGFVVDVFRDEDESPSRPKKMTHL